MRVFLDANVLFSASNAPSNIAKVVAEAEKRGHVLVTCDLAAEEARRNITLKRPAWLAGFETLTARVEVAPSVHFPLPVDLAGKDVPILCAAIRSHCDVLVTGDRRDFGHLYDHVVEGVRVVSLLRFGELVLGGG